MNYEQKRFTIRQIDHYQDQSQELKNKIDKEKWWIYGCSVAAILGLGLIDTANMPSWGELITRVVGWCGISFGIDHLKNMIDSVAKKAGLENMATDLQYQIDNAELSNNENKNEDYNGYKY